MTRLTGLGTESIGSPSHGQKFKIRSGTSEPPPFKKWISSRKVRWNLMSNSDENPLHHDTRVAQDFIEIAYSKQVLSKILGMDKKPIIGQGLWLLVQSEQIAAEELTSEPLLPISLNVVFSSPLIVDSRQLVYSRQLVCFIPKRLGHNQYGFQAKYASGRGRKSGYEKIFEKPIMESRAPFVFCSATKRESGITELIKKEFAEVLSILSKGGEYIRQGKEERKAYCKSVEFSLKHFKKIYGKENISPTLIAARIPSDIVVDAEIYQNSNEIFLWRRQQLYFDQTVLCREDEYVEKKVLVKKEKKGVIEVDAAFLTEDGMIICLGRSKIVKLTKGDKK